MMVVGVDPHKQSHTAVAADELGRKKAQKTVRARRAGRERASPTRLTRWPSPGWRCARARAFPRPASMPRSWKCGG